MHTLLSETQDSFVALRLSGKLDKSDYEAIVPLLEERITAHDKIWQAAFLV